MQTTLHRHITADDMTKWFEWAQPMATIRIMPGCARIDGFVRRVIIQQTNGKNSSKPRWRIMYGPRSLANKHFQNAGMECIMPSLIARRNPAGLVVPPAPTGIEDKWFGIRNAPRHPVDSDGAVWHVYSGSGIMVWCDGTSYETLPFDHADTKLSDVSALILSRVGLKQKNTHLVMVE